MALAFAARMIGQGYWKRNTALL